MYCGKCGTKAAEGAKFCPVCGNQLKAPQGKTAVRQPAAAPVNWRKTLVICLAVLVFVTAIAGMGGGRRKLLGTWYPAGSSSAKFTLYDDGSCLIPHHYGKGKWSVVNGDQLSVSDFYGQTRIFTIISADGQKLVLDQHLGSGTGTMGAETYWKSPNR